MIEVRDALRYTSEYCKDFCTIKSLIDAKCSFDELAALVLGGAA